jgi:small subunit ribosomal protein S16
VAVKIRLARHGAKKAPFYRVVVADGRARRDGRFIEIIGRYDPRTDPSTVEIDVDKATAWIEKGAQPTEAVVKLIAIAKGEKVVVETEARPSKKAAAKAADEAKAAEKAAEEPPAPAEEAAEETPVADEEPAEEAAVEDAPAEEAPAEEAPAEDAAPADEEPAVDEPEAAEAEPAEEAPATEEPAAEDAE